MPPDPPPAIDPAHWRDPGDGVGWWRSGPRWPTQGKGKGMGDRDTMMHLVWEGFISETAMVDPFHVHSPKRRIYSFVSNAGKSRGDRVYVNEENVRMSLTTSNL